jgi:hypothetical protein
MHGARGKDSALLCMNGGTWQGGTGMGGGTHARYKCSIVTTGINRCSMLYQNTAGSSYTGLAEKSYNRGSSF